MKKIGLILLIVIPFNVTISQTKAESQMWISSTIENYVNKTMYHRLFNFYFDEDSMMTVTLVNGELYYEKIRLKAINNVIVKESNEGYELILHCKNVNDSYCVETGIFEDTGSGSAKPIPSIDPKTRLKIYLDRSMRDDNMASRLKKAIIHLITISGGSVITNKF